MSIYIDNEYESTTLADLLVEAQEVAREAWYRNVEYSVVYTYRDLARADVKAGRSTPQDHPSLHHSVFVDDTYGINDARVAETWARELVDQLTVPSVLVKP